MTAPSPAKPSSPPRPRPGAPPPRSADSRRFPRARRGSPLARSLPDLVALAVLVLLLIFVAGRLGTFSLFATVPTADGPVRLPNGFAGVDHPFHTARAATLLASLAEGQPLRWIPHHQGGYPAEFYPLGVAWLEVGLWALALGALPVVVVHKLAVILIFFLPALAFVLLARRDRWPLAVAVAAAAAHLAIPGDWDHGGYTELVQWGLVTNVAAATALLFVLAWLTDFLISGRRLAGAGAVLAAAFAVTANPRSLIALAVVGLAALLAAAASRTGAGARPRAAAWSRLRSGESRSAATGDLAYRRDPSAPGGLTGAAAPAPPTLARVVARLALVAALVGLLAAPILVSLLRFSHLYAFVQYQSYAGVADYFATSVAAVGRPVFGLALAGVAAAWLLPGRPASRAAAAALLLYAAATLLVMRPAVAAFVPQLEATRLMPFQRVLTLYLAASALGAVGTWLASWLPAGNEEHGIPPVASSEPVPAHRDVAVARGNADDVPWVSTRRAWLPTLLLLATAAATLATYVAPPGATAPVPAVDVPRRGLYPVTTTAAPEFLDLRQAIAAADAAAPSGTALLVLGSALSWHEPLWAPLWTARPLFYDDWLWSWHPDHAGPPGSALGGANNYPAPELALDPSYLERHGIGAVAVTGAAASSARAAAAAAQSPDLRRVRDGLYDVYVVRRTTTVVAFAGENTVTVSFGGQHLVAAGTSGGGEAQIGQNWYPRWRATVNGRPAFVARAADGTMRVPIPAGEVRLDLSYVVDAWDWTARTLALVGLLGLVALAVGGWDRSRLMPVAEPESTA